MNFADNTRRSFLAKSLAAAAALALGSLGRAQGKAKWNEAMNLTVDFSVDPSGFGRINRPYVAVWVENGSGDLVRGLSLWADTGRRIRYVEHLERFLRDVFALAGGSQAATQYVTSISSPTREPGKFSVVWDGKSDKKALVDQGDYFVCIESAVEHGNYSLVRQKFTFANEPFSKKLDGDSDIKGVSLEYAKRK